MATTYGTSGSDSLVGTDEADSLYGLEGNDTLSGGLGADTMFGGLGSDTYYVDNALDVIVEQRYPDDWDYDWHDHVISTVTWVLGAHLEHMTLTGDAAINGTGNERDNELRGNQASNILSGHDGRDSIYGGAGDDILYGGEGADHLDGGSGKDTIFGGGDSDTYYVDSALDVIVEYAGEGHYDHVISSVTWALGDNLEMLTLTGAVAINGTGNNLDNIIKGNQAINILAAEAGRDILYGGGGSDILYGGADGDSLYGDAGNDVLYGEAGKDRLEGGTGKDTMIGGGGDDLYIVDNALDVIVEEEGEGTDVVFSSVSWTLSEHVEELSLTGSGNINGTGNETSNILSGNQGNNILSGKGGNDTLHGYQSDTLIGGTGDDWYVVNSAQNVVIEKAGEGFDTVASSVDWTLTAHVENLILLGGASNGTGNALNNTIQGTAWDNVLNGGKGSDTLKGGGGNDTYVVDNVRDVIIETVYDGVGIDLVQSSVSWTLGEHLENLHLTGNANINGKGNALNNKLWGNDGHNILNGGAGADTLAGGGGDDTYIVDRPQDVVVENAGEGIDLVKSSVSWKLGLNLENLLLTGGASTNGIGNGTGNVITGNTGENVLDGRGGSDTLIGGAGNDHLTGGAGKDVFVFNTSLNAITNLDIITDFVAADDAIHLDSTIFTSLTTANVTLAGTGNFRANAAGVAMDSNDFVVYNTTSGALYYDADGNGAGEAVQFATLIGSPVIAGGDFFVV